MGETAILQSERKESKEKANEPFLSKSHKTNFSADFNDEKSK